MVDVSLRRFVPSDAQWLVARHQDLYARDEGFDASFGPLVADILQRFCAAHDPHRERGWIAAAGRRRLGSIFCMAKNGDTARLRLFLISPEARGKGLGKRLLRDCMHFARQADYREMQLSTHETHRAAGALYHAFGWQLIKSVPVKSFGVNLIEQTWRVML